MSPERTASALDASVRRVVDDSRSWANLSPTQRAKRLRAIRHRIVERQERLSLVVSAESDKPVTEAMAQEITATLGMLKYMERHYPAWLRSHRFRYLRPGFWSKRNVVRYEPLGVVAVIGPSNFPFSLIVMQACSALLCGDGVVIKPSDKCPKTGRLIEQIFDTGRTPGFPVAVVSADPAATEDLVAHPAVDKVIFTGSSQVGERIANLCGQHFKPCVLELGGHGAAIVLPDANLQLTARGLIWSAVYTGGRSCIGTRIVFVLPGIRDALLPELEQEYGRLRRGSPAEPAVDVSESARLDLADSLQIAEVLTVEDAIEAINASPYGLSASVWSRNSGAAEQIASKLKVGMVWVNDSSAALPGFPWGGTRRSGWGRLFSREALAELTQTKVISTDRSRTVQRKPWWYPYSTAQFELLKALNGFLFGRRRMSNFGKAIGTLWRYLRTGRQ